MPLNHLDVEVASTEEVTAAQARLVAAGLATAVEDQNGVDLPAFRIDQCQCEVEVARSLPTTTKAKAFDLLDADEMCRAAVPTTRLSEPDAAELAHVLAALADPVRLRLLSIVASSPEVRSCELEGPLAKSQPTISHHTKILAVAGLKFRRQTRQMGLVARHPEPPCRHPQSPRRLVSYDASAQLRRFGAACLGNEAENEDPGFLAVEGVDLAGSPPLPTGCPDV